MFWTSAELRKEEKIRERLARYQKQYAKAQTDLAKLYDKVYKRNVKESPEYLTICK